MVKSKRPVPEDSSLIELKRVWHEYGRSAVLGIVLGAGAIISWFSWGHYEEQHAKEAFDLFIEINDEAEAGSVESVESLFGELEGGYSKTPYVVLSAMTRAHFYITRDDLPKAAESLELAVDYAVAQDIKFLEGIATVRLARVLFAQGENERALDILSADLPTGIAALGSEVRGDILSAMNKKQEAADAYRDASAVNDSTGFLYMKSQHLGVSPTPQKQ